MDIVDKLKTAYEEFDAERCLADVRDIYSIDLNGDFAHFEHTSRLVAQKMERIGLSEVERLPLRADGEARYGDWTMPRAWTLRAASLYLIGPDGACTALADSADTRLCCAMFSAATDGPRRCRLVDGDRGETHAWRGAVLFTRTAPRAMVRAAMLHGAAGIISDHFPAYPGVRGGDDMAGHTRWENDLFYPRNDSPLFGFSLTPEAGEKVRAVLDGRGDSWLEANVDADSGTGLVYTVSGLIPGDGRAGEVMLLAHLYEPGANDNATGAAALLELARWLMRALEGRPHGDVRLVMGYEAAGVMGYVAAHPERVRSAFEALNMDMVGAAASECATLHLWHNPHSNWSFTDALLPALAARLGVVTALEFEEMAFEVGDCLLADPMIGVPTMSMVMHPARSYHSSMDDMSRVSADSLRRNGALAAVYVRMLASPDAADIAFARAALDGMPEGPRREMAEHRFAKWACIGDLARVPRRTTFGPATLGGRMRGIDPALDPFYDALLNCALFWADGRRTLAEILRLTGRERGVEMDVDTKGRLIAFFDALQAAGIVEYLS